MWSFFFLFFLVLRVVFLTSTSKSAWMMLNLETRAIRVKLGDHQSGLESEQTFELLADLKLHCNYILLISCFSGLGSKSLITEL